MAGQKFNSDKTNKPSFFQKHWWKIGISLLFITALVFFGYNKYLDQQNVSNMEQLLADFEKLKTDVEAETGEKLFIEATCGSVGKFATSYACSIYLKNDLNKLFDYSKFIQIKSSLLKTSNRCRVIQSKDASYLNFYSCVIHVRSSNTNKAETIYYKYDTSPGSAI